jgi:hypothetical protein
METLINGSAEILRRSGEAIDEKGFDIRFKGTKNGIAINNVVPIGEVKRGLHGPAGTGILRNDATRVGVVDEEGEVDGNEQALPLLIVHGEVDEAANVARNALETLVGVASEKNGAGIAGAGDATLLQLQQVLVLCRKWSRAQLAEL